MSRAVPPLVAAGLALCLADGAAAKMVPRAEKGAILLLAEAAPAGLDQPVVVARGDVAWTETYHPQQAVRLLSPAAKRVRPTLPGLAVGTVLFAYQLPSGVAYCPRADFHAASPDIQCLRDFDDDGTFDGGYAVEWQGGHSGVLPEVLESLVAIPKVRYVQIDAAGEMPTPARVTFEGFEKGQAQFLVRVEQEPLDTKETCRPTADGDCEVLGLTLHVTPSGAGARIALVSAAAGRGINVITSGGPDISGFDRHPRSGNGQ